MRALSKVVLSIAWLIVAGEVGLSQRHDVNRMKGGVRSVVVTTSPPGELLNGMPVSVIGTITFNFNL